MNTGIGGVWLGGEISRRDNLEVTILWVNIYWIGII